MKGMSFVFFLEKFRVGSFAKIRGNDFDDLSGMISTSKVDYQNHPYFLKHLPRFHLVISLIFAVKQREGKKIFPINKL